VITDGLSTKIRVERDALRNPDRLIGGPGPENDKSSGARNDNLNQNRRFVHLFTIQPDRKMLEELASSRIK
jgi:hypothetical protein